MWQCINKLASQSTFEMMHAAAQQAQLLCQLERTQPLVLVSPSTDLTEAMAAEAESPPQERAPTIAHKHALVDLHLDAFDMTAFASWNRAEEAAVRCMRCSCHLMPCHPRLFELRVRTRFLPAHLERASKQR